MKNFFSLLYRCTEDVLPKAGKTTLWLLKIILPISLLVRLLQYSGVLASCAGFLDPVFAFIGLPGESAIVFLTSIFLPLYSSIAVMASLTLTLREATILAVMCLVAHNLLVECAIQKKTGSSFQGMIALRIGMALLIAFVLNRIMPVYGETFSVVLQPESFGSVPEVLVAWIKTSWVLTVTIMVILTLLLIFQRLLEHYNLMDALARPLVPVMRFFGMPGEASFLWVIGNSVGLAYGGAVMVEQVESGKLSRKDADVVNHHLAISHSLLEDTFLFVVLGISFWWIFLTRLFFAFIVVWCMRLVNRLGRVRQRIGTV